MNDQEREELRKLIDRELTIFRAKLHQKVFEFIERREKPVYTEFVNRCGGDHGIINFCEICKS